MKEVLGGLGSPAPGKLPTKRLSRGMNSQFILLRHTRA